MILKYYSYKEENIYWVILIEMFNVYSVLDKDNNIYSYIKMFNKVSD